MTTFEKPRLWCLGKRELLLNPVHVHMCVLVYVCAFSLKRDVKEDDQKHDISIVQTKICIFPREAA